VASTAGGSGLASRYALALFALADEQKKLDAVAEDLRGLDAMLVGSDALARLVRSPVLRRADQGKAMAALLDAAGADALTRNFVGVVATNRRLAALRQIIRAFLDELARRRGEVAADVTSAAPLTDAQQRAVEEALNKVVGRKVQLSLAVDPSLIGGMVVKVGSRMVDSSVKTQLQRLKLAMKGAA